VRYKDNICTYPPLQPAYTQQSTGFQTYKKISNAVFVTCLRELYLLNKNTPYLGLTQNWRCKQAISLTTASAAHCLWYSVWTPSILGFLRIKQQGQIKGCQVLKGMPLPYSGSCP
jgi:hypothetical protein